MKRLTWSFVCLVLLPIATTLGQVNPAPHPYHGPRKVLEPHKIQPTCETGPAPQVQGTTQAVYVHLSWAAVPGVASYHIDRFDTTYPDESPAIYNVSSTTLEYWDVPSDIRDDFRYDIAAIQPNGCYGTTSFTVPHSSFSTPNPTNAMAQWTSAKDGVLMWAPVFGAVNYRIDSAGNTVNGVVLDVSGITFKAGTWNPGAPPTQGPYSMGLTSNNTNTSFGTSQCPGCSLEVALGGSLSQVVASGKGYPQYSITALYAGNWADYDHATKVLMGPPPTCSVSQMTPKNGPIGQKVTLTGDEFQFASAVSFQTWNGVVFGMPFNATATTVSIDTSSFRFATDVGWYGNFFVFNGSVACSSPTFQFLPIGSSSSSSGGGQTTTPPAQVGGLKVTLGFTAGKGEQCTGTGTIILQPGKLTGSNGTTKQTQQNVTFSGLASDVTIGGTSTTGCTASSLFQNMAPGSWTVRAGSPGGPSAACSATITANQLSTKTIWDLVCF